MAQYGSHTAPRGRKAAPRQLRMATEPNPHRRPPRGAKSCKNRTKINELYILACSFLMAFRGLKTAPGRPVRAPRRPQ
eukprot:24447-Pyramimonas_sp.AAC.1